MRFRASELGLIMADERSAVITPTQLKELNKLLERISLTDKQSIRRDELIAKRDAPPVLSQGAKSYIQKKCIEDKYGFSKDIESRYLEKGILVEDEGIQIASSALGWHLVFKNEEHFKNDYIQGTPDVITEGFIADIKSSWSLDTFPWFDTEVKNKIYYWQLQAYMYLCDKPTSYLVYVLVNTPEHLVNKEVEHYKWRAKDNLDLLDLPVEMESDIYEEIAAKHNFDNIPFEKRVKAFEVEADISAQVKIREKVELAREYYEEVYALL